MATIAPKNNLEELEDPLPLPLPLLPSPSSPSFLTGAAGHFLSHLAPPSIE